MSNHNFFVFLSIVLALCQFYCQKYGFFLVYKNENLYFCRLENVENVKEISRIIISINNLFL